MVLGKCHGVCDTPPVLVSAAPFLLLLLAGFVAGFFGSSVGGGGLVSLPALLLLGLPTSAAIATNRFAVVFGEGMSILQYRRTQRLPWLLAATIGLLAAAGSYVGSRLVLSLPEHMLNVLVATALVSVLIILLLHPQLGAREHALRGRQKIFIYAGAFVLGIYGGFIGTGFGTFIMLLLASGGFSLLRSAAMARVVGFFVSLVAALSFASADTIRYAEGAALAAGFMIGCFFGVRTSVRRGNDYVRSLLLFVVILAVGQLLWKTVGA
jgi:uncharacterized membrane protein YfcA